MLKTIIFIIFVTLSIAVRVNSLQCYVCYNCMQVKEEYVKSCDSIPPPTNSSTTTTTTTPTTPTNTTSNNTMSTTNIKSLKVLENLNARDERADIHYECFQGKVHENNTDMIVRGCAVGRSNETCEGFGLMDCSFCSTDKCNAAGSIQSSAVLLSALFLTLLLKE